MKKTALFLSALFLSVMMYAHPFKANGYESTYTNHPLTKIHALQNGVTIYYNIKATKTIDNANSLFTPQYVVKKTKPVKQEAIYCKVHCSGGSEVSCVVCSCAEARRLCGGD